MRRRRSRRKVTKKPRVTRRRRRPAGRSRLWLLLFVLAGLLAVYLVFLQPPGSMPAGLSDAYSNAVERAGFWYSRKRADSAFEEASLPPSVREKETKEAGAFFDFASIGSTIGQYTQSIPNFEDCLRLPETDIADKFNVQHMRAMALRAVGKNEEAIATIEELITSSGPEKVKYELIPRALLLRADVELRLPESKGGGPQAAARTYRQFLESAGGRPGMWEKYRPRAMRAMGDCLREAGDRNAALAAYDEFLQQYPTDASCSLVALERLRLTKGPKGRLAAAEVKQIIDTYGADTGAGQQVLYALAMAHVRAGRLEPAVKLLRQVMKFNPNPRDDSYAPEAIAAAGLDLAVLLGQLDRERERKQVLEEVIERFGELPQADTARRLLERIEKRRD